MTGGPHVSPKPRRRGGPLIAALAALGMLAGQAPASGQSTPQSDTRPCANLDSASRASCANQPLDAFRNAPPPAPKPAPQPINSLRIVGRPAELAAARIGRAYPPAQLVVGGTRPYNVRTYGLPPSLHVTADGFLVGLPAAGEAGDYPFGVVVQDAEGQEIRQLYRLRITGAPAAAPRPRPPTPAPTPTPKPPEPPPPPAPAEIDGRITVYVLRAADLKPPVPVLAPAPAASAALPPPPPPPPPSPASSATGKVKIVVPAQTAPAPPPPSAEYPTDLALRAKGMINVEYPTRELFRYALAADYAAQPLSEAQLNLVADAAAESRSFSLAPKLNWAPEAGCGCAVPVSAQAKTVYGFFPFWRSETPPPSILFSKVSRIGFLGVQLASDGSWTRPSGYSGDPETWWRQTSTFARAAQAHGARLDLVVQRSDWRFLARMDLVERTALYETAARTAVGLANTRLRNRGLSALLLPFWKEPKYVFDGITVDFDYPTNGTSEEIDAYIHFHDGFIRQLIREMQATRRDYVLNIVAPDPLSLQGGATGMGGGELSEASIWRAFLSYKRMAEPQSFHRAAPPEDKARFIGRTKIRVNLIAPVREPTSPSKKALRATIDGLTEVKGYNRVAVLNSILPAFYLPGGDGPFDEAPPGFKAKPKPKPKPVARSKADKAQLDDDLIYARQNFGGVALWPAPVQKLGIGDEVYADLDRIFYQVDTGPLALVTSQVICSLLLRLLWQVMVVVMILAVVAYLVWGQGSGRAKLYRRGLLGLGIALFALSFFLLTVDPALAALSRSNIPLFGLVALALGGAGWRTAKPKIPQP